MFCPKCGNQLPDGSAFCGKCGAQLSQPNAGGARAGTASPTFAVGISPVAIVGVVFAAVAVILSLMPWFEVYAEYASLTSYVDQAASFFGLGSSDSLSFDEAYAPWALPGFAGTFSEYASLYGALGGSDADAIAAIVAITCWACTLLWAVAAVLLVVGVIGVLRGSGRTPMLAAAVVAVVCAVAFLVFSGMASDIGEGTVMPVLFAAASIAAAVCAFVGRRA